jgi:hypothetical protein
MTKKVNLVRSYKGFAVLNGKPTGAVNSRSPNVDLTAYPILTEEVGYPPSPLATPSSGASAPSAGGTGTSIGAIATKALNDVLGWKFKTDDPTGFVGALKQSFSLSLVEGHVESTWTPRTYAVSTDLAGGVTGAQAAIYSRAKDALDQSLPLLDGLYALNPTADPEVVSALREILRSEMTELVGELGLLGGPRVSRVNQYFSFLLGWTAPSIGPTDPDQITGTLAQLRNELGVWSFGSAASGGLGNNPWVNTIEDEQDVTNYRILSDYLTSIAITWSNNYSFFLRDQIGAGAMPLQAFLGTQLVLISRQLSVVNEAVNEVRFAMDSVFLGPAERETLLIQFSTVAAGGPPSMFVEEFLRWIESFSTVEGVTLIQKAGKLGIGRGFIDIVTNLQALASQAAIPVNSTSVPPGYLTPRVQLTWQNLSSQLTELLTLSQPVSLVHIPPEVH